MNKKFSRAKGIKSFTLSTKKITYIFSKIDFRENGCWQWLGHSDNSGYCQIRHNNIRMGIHQFMYAWIIGDIPKGYIVRHTCHNRKCANPEHLLLGTMWDNSQDMIKAGRSLTGEKNPQSKLTEKLVKEIAILRNNGLTINKIAKELNLSKSVIYRVISGETWNYLNLNINNKDIVDKIKLKCSREKTKEMYSLRQQGFGWIYIGKQFNMSGNGVKKRILKYTQWKNQ